MAKARIAYPRGLDFEQVWAGLQETRKLIEDIARRQEESDRRHEEESRKRQEESDRRQAEAAQRQAEFDRQQAEYARQREEDTRRYEEEARKRREEIELQMKATDKRVGELTGRFGEIVEHMIVPGLVAKFRELGFEFTKAGPDVKIADKKHNIYAEIDAFLENGDKVMIVEIKSKPTIDHVNYHIEKMEKLRKYADFKADTRKYLGAIAGVVVNEGVSNYALKNGFYVIEPSGDTFNITEPKGKYKPREW